MTRTRYDSSIDHSLNAPVGCQLNGPCRSQPDWIRRQHHHRRYLCAVNGQDHKQRPRHSRQLGIIPGVGLRGAQHAVKGPPSNTFATAKEGGAILLSYAVTPGSVLSFNWKWFSQEGSKSTTYNDFAFVTLNGATPTKLADTFTPDNTTGFYSYTSAMTGLLNLGIGVSDAGDQALDSTFTVSNIQFSPAQGVPEPASLALIGLAGLGLLGARRRRV